MCSLFWFYTCNILKLNWHFKWKRLLRLIKKKHMIKWFLCIDCKCLVTINAFICMLTWVLAALVKLQAKGNNVEESETDLR